MEDKNQPVDQDGPAFQQESSASQTTPQQPVITEPSFQPSASLAPQSDTNLLAPQSQTGSSLITTNKSPAKRFILNNKKNKILLVIIVIGLLIAGSAFLPFANPPQCPLDAVTMPDSSSCIIGANIGTGLMYLLGLTIAILAGLGLLLSILLSFASTRTKNPHRNKLIIIVIFVGVLGVAYWYYFEKKPRDIIKESNNTMAEIEADLHKQQETHDSLGIPNANSLSGQSMAVNVKRSGDTVTSVKIDFRECSRGLAVVKNGDRTTTLGFLGVQDYTSVMGDECLFYFESINANTSWDGSLTIRCSAPIEPEPIKEFLVNSSGIQFGDFQKKYCVNLDGQYN